MQMEKVEAKIIAKNNEMRLEWNRLEGTKTSCIRFEPLVFMVMCLLLLYIPGLLSYEISIYLQ